MPLKELQETRYWLRIVAGAELAEGPAVPAALAEVDALCRILGTSKRTASINRSPLRPEPPAPTA